MKRILKSQDLSFQAEVVAVFEREGRRVAKLLVHSFFVEIDAQDLADAHLGDTLVFSQIAEPGPAPTTGSEPR
jgi:hypothetical protein